MEVCKLHALGNDFLVVRVEHPKLEAVDYSPIATALCDRHYGIGADGLMIVAGLSSGDVPVYGTRIFNVDGSEAEMSGNGIRCTATYLMHFCDLQADRIHFETKAGLRKARFLERREYTYFFETSMGVPDFNSARIPMILTDPIEPVVRYPLSVGTSVVEITALSMGNPHCVVFCNHYGEIDQDFLGFSLSNHPAFPNRTNVEFVQVLARDEIRVLFWERGVGATYSSGTGSCAAAVAGAVNGCTDERLTVRTSSGKVVVDWRDRREVYLTGPAEILCKCEFYLPASAACELY